MQVGDLVRWQDAEGNFELGVVVDLYTGSLYTNGRVLVYFPQDNGNSYISTDDLEIVCK